MAIKGKKRSKGGRARARAAAPKPKLVEVKPPLAQRPWFRYTLLGLLVGVVALVAYLFWADYQADKRAEEERKAVARTGVAIENALIPVGEVAPGGTSVIILTELSTTLQEIQSGEFKESQVRSRVEEWLADIEGAQEGLDGVRTDNPDLRRAIRGLKEGLGLYTGVVNTVPDTLELEVEEREARLTEIQIQLQEATSQVQSAWLIYQNERTDVGLNQGTPGMGTGVPPGFPPGGEIPGLPPGSDIPGLPPGSDIPGFPPGEEIPIPEET